MGRDKSKIKQNADIRNAVILGVLGIAAFYLLAYGSLKIEGLVGEELTVSVEPANVGLNLYHGESKDVRFAVSSRNAPLCAADCNYSFVSLENNSELASGSMKLGKEEQQDITVQITAPKYGSGQLIYRLSVECRNAGALCQKKDSASSASSFITMNFGPSPEEEEIIRNLNKTLSEFFAGIISADRNLLLVENISESEAVNRVLFNDKALLKERVMDVKKNFLMLVNAAKNFDSLWRSERYLELDGEIGKEDYAGMLKETNASITNLSKELRALVSKWNSFVEEYENITNRTIVISDACESLISSRSKLREECSDFISLFNSISRNISQQKYSSEKAESALNALMKKEVLLESKLNDEAAGMLSNAENLSFMKDVFLCGIKERCGEDPGKVQNEGVNQEAGKQEALKARIDALREHCREFSNFDEEFAQADLNLLKNFSGYFDIRINDVARPDRELLLREKDRVVSLLGLNHTQQRLAGEEFKRRILAVLTQPSPAFMEESNNRILVKSNMLYPEYFAIMGKEWNLSGENINRTEVYDKLLRVSVDIRGDELLLASGIRNCPVEKGNVSGDLEPLFFSELKEAVLEFPAVESKLNFSISINPPLCCVFSQCRPCCHDEECMNDERSFPVVLVHGHAFSRETSPDYSLKIFDKLQKRMEEDGYLSAGFLSPRTDVESIGRNSWGLSGLPVTVRVTYYYDAYNENGKYVAFPEKSESIDVYA
ncbi:hypothetical protein D6764_01065, partial [Candidatus Woesearchaeota archaeon]